MFGRLRSKIREEGMIGIFVSLVNRLPGVDYFVIWSVYRLRLDTVFDESEGQELQVSFHNTAEEMDALLGVRDKRERFSARLSRGNVVALARVRGVPVGYMWLQLTPDPVEERYGFTIDIAPTDIYDFDSYVDPDYRGQGVLRVLHREVTRRHVHARGKTHLAAIIEPPNRRSIRAHKYMGFQKGGMYCAFRFLGQARMMRMG